MVVDFIDMEENSNNQAVERRMKEALKNDGGYYRTEQMGNDDENAADLNRIWDVEQNITSIYSSAYNPDYQTFRQKTFGLEEPFRNVMMQSVSKNPVFCRMMGVRYIVSDSDVTGYALVKKCEKTGIYQNNDAAPVMYATDRVMTEKEYNKLNILNRGKTVYRTGTFKVLEFTETISIAHDIYINNIRSR